MADAVLHQCTKNLSKIQENTGLSPVGKSVLQGEFRLEGRRSDASFRAPGSGLS